MAPRRGRKPAEAIQEPVSEFGSAIEAQIKERVTNYETALRERARKALKALDLTLETPAQAKK
jgi:hypothetical protein